MIALSLVLLAASPAPLKVAVPDFSVISVERDAAAFFMDRFANRLRARGLAVTTPAEIESVLGLERQKALLGCAESSSSCQAEIAAALGADAIIRGRIARFGQRFELSLTLIDPATAGVMASISPSAADEGKVLEALDAAADELSSKLFAEKRREAPVVEVSAAPSAGRPRWIAAIPLAVGAGAAVLGGVGLAESYRHRDRIATAPDLEQATSAANDARTARAAGITLLCVSGAALATAGVLFFTGATPAATPVAFVSPQGAYVGVEGRLP